VTVQKRHTHSLARLDAEMADISSIHIALGRTKSCSHIQLQGGWEMWSNLVPSYNLLIIEGGKADFDRLLVASNTRFKELKTIISSKSENL
jgi:hypothetical protein